MKQLSSGKQAVQTSGGVKSTAPSIEARASTMARTRRKLSKYGEDFGEGLVSPDIQLLTPLSQIVFHYKQGKTRCV